MFYSLYLMLLAQFSSGSKAKLKFCDKEIIITKRAKEWVLESVFFFSEGSPLEDIQTLQLQSSSLFLKKHPKTGHYHLIQKIKPIKRFMQFREVIQNYLEILAFWKSVALEAIA